MLVDIEALRSSTPRVQLLGIVARTMVSAVAKMTCGVCWRVIK